MWMLKYIKADIDSEVEAPKRKKYHHLRLNIDLLAIRRNRSYEMTEKENIQGTGKDPTKGIILRGNQDTANIGKNVVKAKISYMKNI